MEYSGRAQEPFAIHVIKLMPKAHRLLCLSDAAVGEQAISLRRLGEK